MAKSTKRVDTPLAQRRRQVRRERLQQVDVQSLLAIFPHELIEELAEKTAVDVQVKHLWGSLLVQLMVYAILSERDDSLRNLEAVYNSESFRIFSGKSHHKTRHSSLASRLSSVNVEFFERLFAGFMAEIQRKYGKKLEKEFGWLLRVDSTMIALSAALGKTGMRVGAKPKSGPGKVQIKVSLALKGLLPSHAKVFTEQPFLSEERALKQVIDESELKDGDVVVFDRGMKGRKAFQSLNERGCQFVTRLREPRYEVIEVHQEVKGLTDGNLRFVDDLIVHLYQSGETKILPAPFRLVIAQAIQGEHAGKTFYFLTNIHEMSAAQIAQAYLRRWDIEVFFRFLKQEMGLRNLLFHNENGIKAVLYLRLFTATLFRLYMWLNKRTDYKISKRVLQSELEIAIAKSLAVLFIQEREFMENINPDLKKYILPLSP